MQNLTNCIQYGNLQIIEDDGNVFVGKVNEVFSSAKFSEIISAIGIFYLDPIEVSIIEEQDSSSTAPIGLG